MDVVIQTLLEERQRLLVRIEDEREQLERLQLLVESLSDRVSHDEHVLDEIEVALGNDPQLRLDDIDLRLRGQKLEAVALAILSEEREDGAEVHYREWYELLRARGHRVAGKQPINTFLAQINRSSSVQSLGRRSGRYRLADVA